MNKAEIRKLISKYQDKQLRELICLLVEKNIMAQKAFLEYCKKQEETVKTEKYDGIIEKQIQNCWKSASDIIEEFDMYGGGPEEEEDQVYETLENMQELFEEGQVSWKFKKSILDEMLQFVMSDNSGLGDALMDLILDAVCVTKEEKCYLADFLVKNCTGYYHNVGAEIYLEYGKTEKYLSSKKENLTYASDYLELAKYYQKHKDEKQALKLAKEGLEKGQGCQDEIYRYLFEYYKKKGNEAELEKLYKNARKKRQSQNTITELMYEYYKEQENYDKKKEMLLTLIENSTFDFRKLYERSVRELTQEDFKKEEAGILERMKERDPKTYFMIQMEKGKTKELLGYLKKQNDWGSIRRIDEGHYFSKQLEKLYPRDIVELYWDEAEKYTKLGKEENYRCAVGNLVDIRKIMKENHWDEEWQKRYKNFREKHKRKRILMGLLEKQKGL